MSSSPPPPDPLQETIVRLLSGPQRPGQAFCMPGCNYGELYRMARRIKTFLDALPADEPPVGLCSDDRATMAAAMLAALAGGHRLILPHALSAAALADLQRLTGITRAIAAADTPLPQGVAAVDVAALTDEVETLAGDILPDLDGPWVSLFTGGSTGAPRLWSKSPRNLLGETAYLAERFAVGHGDRILATVPALHIYGLLYSLLLPLVASARVVAATPSFPEEIKQQMAGCMPTLFISVPVHYRALKASPPPAGALRAAFSSAGPLAEADGVAFSAATGVDLFEVYGSTETGGIATRCRARDEAGFTPYGCIEWRITGEELDIRSAFLSQELPVRSSGWYTVPDRVKPSGDTGFTVAGRMDNIVKVGGNRVDLEKIRQAILSLDGVDEAQVLANPVETGREREIAAVFVGSRSAADIRTALEAVLEPHEKPRQVHRVAEIPMAATGKIDRRAIADLTVPRTVRFEPAGLNVPLNAEQSLQALAADHGIAIRADCGGTGICGKCRVMVHPEANFSPLTDAERDVLTPARIAEGSRLACQARATGEGRITIPDTLTESAETRGKTGIDVRCAVDPMIRRLTVAGDPPTIKADNLPQSLVDWLAARAGDPAAAGDITALRSLSTYRDSLKAFTLVVHAESGIRRILPGHQTASLGFAVDLGTTSLAGYLCDLATGKLLAADACVNPQRRFGEDVISRICRINEDDAHLAQLQGLAVEGVDFLLTRCLERVGAARDAVDEVAICGNTTMEQIVARIHPHGLGESPYFPLTLTPPPLCAGDLGLTLDPAVPVFLMPMVSGFVGGDTMGAILADRPHERDAVTLIVDIGTNGELVLGNRRQLWVTSCATGPALEGAQISCGMRAVSGAIHRVRADVEDNKLVFDVLGEGDENRPLGICGSGIIDAVAAMRRLGIIRPNGRLDEGKPGVVSDDTGVGRRYVIADRRRSLSGNDIAVTLKDVRQIQLAKSALSVGIDFLMRKAGIEKIDRTVLTGAFGAHFDWENALAIGMFPPAVAASRVESRDNLAGVGVVAALLDRKLRSEAGALCRRIRYLELASAPDFAMAFARATAFPELNK